ncbi:MAG: sigma-54-dependent Fis family transcriptional regulator [Deltaproteobacteria bacterium]|nr:sigma-54-dependent Fis family transcriptional regulator [Deltaproteobacteria bacterium]
MERILVVDDELGMRLGLSEVLERAGFAVTAVEDGATALDALAAQPHAVVISDMRMPGMSGGELLAAVQSRYPGLPMIMMTAYGTVEDAVTAMKRGAREFLAKPFSPQDVLHLVRGILDDPEPRGSTRREDGIAMSPAMPPPGGRIVTNSPVMARVLQVAEAVAASRSAVLIAGESGTGKELLARHIHTVGPRSHHAFVAVNCAALPRELLESELFGHERGAFTGAVVRKLGKFELANRGTILLDEISEMEPLLQAKLLRVLQEYEVDRVGGSRPVSIDVRVIATTNRDLREMVASGAFRRDLYYRLHVVPLTLPPLRERIEDIDALTDHFCARFSAGRAVNVDATARALLHRHRWPGNVRELEHTIERAVLLSSGSMLGAADLQIDEDPLGTEPAKETSISLAGRTVHEVERQLIFETLQRTNNNRSHAARMLGISVRTLRNKLAEYRSSGLMEQRPS